MIINTEKLSRSILYNIYIANRGSPDEDKQRFTKLVQTLYAAYKPNNLLLTAALGAGKETVDSAYEIAKISQSVNSSLLFHFNL